MPRTVSIHRSLLLNLTVGIVLFAGAIWLVSVFGTRSVILELTRQIIDRSLDQVELDLQGFIEPMRRGLLVSREWGEADVVGPDDPEAVRKIYEPFMRQFSHVTSVLVADDRGHEVMLLRMGDVWKLRQTRRDEWGGETRWLEWREGEEPKSSTQALDYDPRQRPWFRGAVATLQETGKSSLHWTEAYTFYTTGDPGTTASIAFEMPDGTTRVHGFDLLLSDVSRFTQGLEVSERGLVFVLSDDRRVVGLPRDDRFVDVQAMREALLREPQELGLQVAADGVEAFDAGGGAPGEPIQFWSGGELWWLEVRPFLLSPDRQLWLAVVVPEGDVLTGLGTIRMWILILGGLALALAVLRAAILARRYSRPIEALAQQSDRISQGQLEAKLEVRPKIRELRQLAEAQERMRSSLATLFKLESDLRLARQIQERTFPATMPRVAGYEIDGWSEPADETGGDTYDIIAFHQSEVGDVRFTADEKTDNALLLLADATGHGIGPALSVTQVRSMLRMALRMGGDLSRIAGHLNEQLCDDLHAGRFVTAWLGVLDGQRHSIASFSAGQAPILHYRAASEDFESRRADTMPLGIFGGQEITASDPIPLEPGDVFAVFSDGIFEADGPDGKIFGEERVCAVIREFANGSPSEILHAVRSAVADYTEGAPARDDRTAVIIKRMR